MRSILRMLGIGIGAVLVSSALSGCIIKREEAGLGRVVEIVERETEMGWMDSKVPGNTICFYLLNERGEMIYGEKDGYGTAGSIAQDRIARQSTAQDFNVVRYKGRPNGEYSKSLYPQTTELADFRIWVDGKAPKFPAGLSVPGRLEQLTTNHP